MLRTLKYFFLLGILILLTLFALSLKGTVLIEITDYRIQTSLLVFAGICLGTFLILYFIIRGYQNIRGIPLIIERYFQMRNLKSGMENLQETVHFFEAQDYQNMMRSAERIQKFLPDRMLGLYYKSVAAQNMGDFKNREVYLKELMEHPDGAFVAAKLLSELFVKKKKLKEAIRWAEAAHLADKSSPWPLKQLLNLTVSFENFEAAEKYLKQLHTLNRITPDFYRHSQAVLLYQKAKHVKHEEKIHLLEKSNQLDPDFIPTVTLLVKEYLNDGKKSRTQTLIEKTWSTTPHPSLVPFYISIFDDPSADPVFRAKHIQRLVSFNPKSSLGLIEGIKTFIEAELWGQAKDYISRIPDADRTREVLKLMADLEIQEKGNHAKAEEILSHLPEAPHDKAYECEVCNYMTQKWKPNCPSCGNFARLKY